MTAANQIGADKFHDEGNGDTKQRERTIVLGYIRRHEETDGDVGKCIVMFQF